jgi:uncharacterized membrane protein YvbJ
MYCKNCGEVMNDNQAICLKCGVKTGDGKAFCANCGNAVAENAAVCLSCGVAIKSGNGEYLNGKDKIVIALVCFFLGGIGIHNFMLGENKKGIAKIILSLLCGIGSILALIDFIKILMDKYVVDPDKAF